MTDRNLWSSQEEAKLLSLVNKAEVKTEGIREAAKKLGRTVNACSYKYYSGLKSKKVSPIASKAAVKGPKVICHNGISTNAQVIMQRDDLIVAKYNDLVITIEL